MRRVSAGFVALGTSFGIAACADLIGLPDVPDVADATTTPAEGGAPNWGDAGGDDGGAGPIDAAGDAASEPMGQAGPDATTDGGGQADVAPDAPVCAPDPICTTIGPACNATKSAVVTCDRNGGGCLYQASSSPCTNGACNGAAGTAACCTNTCTTAPACVATSSTEIGICTAGSNGCMAVAPVACGSGLVCERYGTASCVDPNWAEWPMPNDTTVDVGAPNPESYTDNGDGTLTDNVTSLVWQRTVPQTTFPFGAASTTGTAQNYCATLALAGYSDWRLPSIIELVSIMDPGQNNYALNNAFPYSNPGFFWSSTPNAASPGSSAWGVNFGTGSVFNNADTSSENVRCVR